MYQNMIPVSPEHARLLRAMHEKQRDVLSDISGNHDGEVSGVNMNQSDLEVLASTMRVAAEKNLPFHLSARSDGKSFTVGMLYFEQPKEGDPWSMWQDAYHGEGSTIKEAVNLMLADMEEHERTRPQRQAAERATMVPYRGSGRSTIE